MKLPSFQFYPGDWQSNKNLRRCTHTEKGIWVDVMCLMHDSDEYGILRWPLVDLAQAVGCKVSDLQALRNKDVLKGAEADEIGPEFWYVPRSGRKDGAPILLVPAQPGPIWYSSRMVRDEHLRGVRGDNSRFTKGSPMGPQSNPMGAAKGESEGDPNGEPGGDGSSSSSSSSSSLKDNVVVIAAQIAKEECLSLINRQYPSWVFSGDKFREFLEYEDHLPWPVLLKAVQTTMASGKTHIGYLLAVCRNWSEANVQTPEEVDALEARKKPASAYSQRPPAQPPRTQQRFQGVDPDEILNG